VPTYSFINSENDEEFDLFFDTIAEKEAWEKENPNIKQTFNSFPGICDAVRLGVKKPDSTFQKYVLGRMANKHNNIDKAKFKIPKEF